MTCKQIKCTCKISKQNAFDQSPINSDPFIAINFPIEEMILDFHEYLT